MGRRIQIIITDGTSALFSESLYRLKNVKMVLLDKYCEECRRKVEDKGHAPSPKTLLRYLHHSRVSLNGCQWLILVLEGSWCVATSGQPVRLPQDQGFPLCSLA